jgi:hypothetical protein
VKGMKKKITETIPIKKCNSTKTFPFTHYCSSSFFSPCAAAGLQRMLDIMRQMATFQAEMVHDIVGFEKNFFSANFK